VERILPYPVARNLVLKGPPEIVAFECPCRATRANPCQPTQVCMIVGQPFVDFVLEHHPARSRRLTTREAVELLEAEHRRGHVHAAYFKDAMLKRFYAICNCCKCCCGGIECMTRHGVPMMTSSGFVAQVNADACAACGTCAEGCAFDAIHVDDQPVSVVDWETCMGCGVCEGQCPNHAITLVRDERKGIPLDVG
jgi:Pyruvate/2-oxoacid:ferredoxin oxidoreductase delta subunit